MSLLHRVSSGVITYCSNLNIGDSSSSNRRDERVSVSVVACPRFEPAMVPSEEPSNQSLSVLLVQGLPLVPRDLRSWIMPSAAILRRRPASKRRLGQLSYPDAKAIRAPAMRYRHRVLLASLSASGPSRAQGPNGGRPSESPQGSPDRAAGPPTLEAAAPNRLTEFPVMS